eukprot:3652531-Pleurochrysis_carterae.AAC.1
MSHVRVGGWLLLSAVAGAYVLMSVHVRASARERESASARARARERASVRPYKQVAAHVHPCCHARSPQRARSCAWERVGK